MIEPVKYTSILVGVDGSKISEKALDTAIQVASESNLHLLIASVINERDILGAVKPASLGFASVTVNELDNIKEQTENLLDKYLDRAKKAGVDASKVISYGNPKEELATNIPSNYGTDVIFIGATGASALSRITLGSTAAFVISNALLDVLVIH